MAGLGGLYQSADWKAEKHVPGHRFSGIQSRKADSLNWP